jgi:hypothetical protein
MGSATKLKIKMALGATFFSFSILVCIIYHQEILDFFDPKTTIKIGEHEFQVDKYERKF